MESIAHSPRRARHHTRGQHPRRDAPVAHGPAAPVARAGHDLLPPRLVIAHDDYEFLRTLLRTQSGLALGVGKEYLLESRLPAVASAFGLASLDELVHLLRTAPHVLLVKAVCEAMTTSETFFFRDGVPFDLLRERILPDAARRCASEGGRALRIWSAAAATGQEPYSVAMVVHELAPLLRHGRVEILATDYASRALNRARRGVYSELEIQRGLAEPLRRRYFVQTPDGYRVDDALRRDMTFQEFNLMDSYAPLGRFDVILCRNVLIYFDLTLKKDVLDRMADALVPGGVLFLGGTETAFSVTDRLVRIPDTTTSVHMRREDVPSVPIRRTTSGAYQAKLR